MGDTSLAPIDEEGKVLLWLSRPTLVNTSCSFPECTFCLLSISCYPGHKVNGHPA